MPEMPVGDPFEFVKRILVAETEIRRGAIMTADSMIDSPYWSDILRLVQVFWASGFEERLDQLKTEFHSEIYRSHLETRRHMRQRIETETDKSTR